MMGVGVNCEDRPAFHRLRRCTQTGNELKDPACHDAPIVELRRLHEEMDRAVLDAYGWTDIVVPPFCPSTPAEQKKAGKKSEGGEGPPGELF